MLLQHISTSIKKKQKKLMLNMNAFGVITFLKNPTYANVIKQADVIYPDGWGPVVASWADSSDHRLSQRVNVGDFIDKLLEMMDEKKLKLCLLGCEKHTVGRTSTVIRKKYPGIKVVGVFPGFFSHAYEKTILKTITQKKPNLILVGMGIPHQEYWLSRNWSKLPVGVYMGIGGVFYYIAGIKSRSPVWMRRTGTEWLYRLMQEPSRLGGRYTWDLMYFGWWLITSFCHQNFWIPQRSSAK